MKNRTTTLIRQSFNGFVIGIILIILFVSVDMVLFNRSLIETFQYNLQHPSSIIILCSPLLLLYYARRINFLHAVEIDELHQALKRELEKSSSIFDFIEQLRAGNTEMDYDLRDAGDVTGKALIDLRDSIKKNKEEEQIRKKEDQQRSWINEGLANFSDILRKEVNNLESLSTQLISNLVKYVNANQGGFFILNDDNPEHKYFQMTACFAYDRKKFSDKNIEWGEGLIGTAAEEKSTIYIEEVPQTYVNITSGLGKATPKSLLIVPLKINEEVHGIIELASFDSFKKYEIEFIEKVAETIASVIANVKINERTARLLAESREQALILKQNEETMRQNMEELQTAQEEAAVQSEKFVTFTDTVNHTLLRAEYTIDGTLIYANTKFLAKLGYQSNLEIEGKHIYSLINSKDRDWFSRIWSVLAEGGRHFEGNMKHITKQGRDLWTMATFTCMRRPDASLEKILFLGIDITEQKQQALNLEGQVSALNYSSIRAEFTIEGEFIDCNLLFIHSFMYESINELDEKKIFDFIERTDMAEFNSIWEKITKGVPYKGDLRCVTKDNHTKWYHLSLSPVKDIYDDIAKIIFLAQDITEVKQMEYDLIKISEQTKMQESAIAELQSEMNRKIERIKRESAEQYRETEKIKLRIERTLEAMADAVVTIDSKGRIIYFNKAAEELWGMPKSEAMGQPAGILFPAQAKRKDEPISKFIDPKESKITGKRVQTTISNTKGDTIPVLCLITDALVGDEHNYTALFQQS
mgnify:CR=1 FL=1